MKWNEIIRESDSERIKRAQSMGFDKLLYHKTDADFTTFKPHSHFGTQAHANDRRIFNRSGNAEHIIPVLVRGKRFVRMQDHGDERWNQTELRKLDHEGYDGVVYLNRHEGIPKSELASLDRAKRHLLSDAEFKAICPSAADSYIVFDPESIRSIHANFTKDYSRDMMA